MAEYDDLIVRQSVDTVSHYGGVRSPDVIPTGLTTTNPELFASPASYEVDPGGGLVSGGVNHVYVRTRTPPGVSAEIRARLYCALAPPTAMLWPDRLVPLRTESDDPYAEIVVPSGLVGVSPSSFVTPADVDVGATLGAYVYTPRHKTTLPTLTSVAALSDFLVKTPSFAQRGTLFVPNAAAGYEYACTYEHRGGEETMVFEISWSDVPGEWRVALDGDHDITLPPTVARGSMSISKSVRLTGGLTAALRWHLSGDAATPSTRFRLLVHRALTSPDRWIPMGGRELRPSAPPSRSSGVVQRR